jgi:phosphoserine phosphatase
MPKKPTEVQETPVQAAVNHPTMSCSDSVIASLLAKNAIVHWQAGCTLNELIAADVAPIAPTGAALLRCWGAAFDNAALAALLALLSQQQPALQAQLSWYQPHPSLVPALSLLLSQAFTASQVAQLRELAADAGYELNYLTKPVLLSQPGVLVMDMDSTAIQIECIDEIAKLAGTGEQVAAVTAAAMRGELDFAQSLRQRVATLRGAPESVLSQVLADIPLMPGLTELVAALQARDWSIAIASGGFTYFTEALRERLNLTATFANQLEIIDGQLSGQVLGDIVDAQAKADVVQLLASARGIAASQTVAIGDGANDLPMLAVAALGVAFHAKPLVQAKAANAIRQGSLLQLLYLLDCEDWSTSQSGLACHDGAGSEDRQV